MRALADLQNDVRDQASRVQLADAVRAYGAGALRAAIISTWVAVALDLTSKIRELADLGDAAALAYVSKLDTAIQAHDVPGLGALERDLLATCRDEFALIDPREAIELDRLQADRHVCAHPAYVAPEVVFSPTAELCRLHMRTAVETVLRHPPSPGRSAIQRFIAEAQDTAWPMNREAIAAHLDARYLRRGRESLRRNLAQVIIKGCVDAPDGDEQLAARMADAALALHQVAPELFTEALNEIVRKREEAAGLSDVQLLRLIGALGSLDLLWQALPEQSHPRVIAALTQGASADLLRLRVTAYPLANADAAAALAMRLADASNTALTAIVTTAPGPALLPVVLDRLAAAGGWRTAEMVMALLPPLAPHFTVPDMARVAEVIETNIEVRQSSGVPPQILNLFERTRHVPGALAVWRELSAWLQTNAPDGDPADYYAYPALAAAVAADS